MQLSTTGSSSWGYGAAKVVKVRRIRACARRLIHSDIANPTWPKGYRRKSLRCGTAKVCKTRTRARACCLIHSDIAIPMRLIGYPKKSLGSGAARVCKNSHGMHPGLRAPPNKFGHRDSHAA